MKVLEYFNFRGEDRESKEWISSHDAFVWSRVKSLLAAKSFEAAAAKIQEIQDDKLFDRMARHIRLLFDEGQRR